MGGLPTAGTLVTGAPNLLATWSMVIPRDGVAHVGFLDGNAIVRRDHVGAA